MELRRISSSLPVVWFVIASLLTGGGVRVAYGCPTRCLCFSTTVRCMFLQLARIPRVPPATTILDLRFNKIKEIPAGSFTRLKKLNTLLLNNNNIKRIDAKVFEGLTDLRYLYLYKNQIKHIDRNAFVGLNKLEQLYIHFNEIEDLEPETFTPLPKLERLFLHNNGLKRLPKSAFSHLGHLKRLRLDSNALICDCQLMWLSEMLKEQSDQTQTAATCKYPVTVQGKSLLTMSKEDFHCSKPRITVQPTDVEVTFGSTVYFTCRADGDPDPEIVWLKNNNELSNLLDENGRFHLLEDGTLMIEDTQDSDQGVYECMARNVIGEVKTQGAQLRYNAGKIKPILTKSPKDYTVQEGEEVTLECEAIGSPKPEIIWTKNDFPLLPNDRYTHSADAGSLTIHNVQHVDGGEYRCTASNNVQSVSASAKLEVQVQPSFIDKPRSQTVTEGQQVELLCTGRGSPPPTIIWQKHGSTLASGGRLYIGTNGNILRIASVKLLDQGAYMCVLQNAAGQKTANAELNINSKVAPTFTKTPVDVEAPVGFSIELECTADGDPYPTITWHKGALAVTNTPRKYAISAVGHLTIENLTTRDTGAYTCTAQNALGRAVAQGHVRVLAIPGRPELIYPGDRFVNQSLAEAIDSVNRGVNNTQRELKDRNRPRTAHDLLKLIRLPSPDAVEISRAAEVYERTLELIFQHLHEGHQYNISKSELNYEDIISPAHLAIIANLSGCARHRRSVSCENMCFHRRYRTLNGACNNLQEPMWGSSLTSLNRILKPVYENGFSTPVGWDLDRLYNGFKKPSARLVSTTALSAHKITADPDYSYMLMQWGQFLDHDIDFSPTVASFSRFSDGRYCNESCENQAPCFPIPVPEGDHRIRHHRCIGVSRSSAMCGTGSTSLFYSKVTPREQINELTSFIDASNVYGSTDGISRDLRDRTNNRGLLRTGLIMPSGKPLLPSNNDLPVDCQIDPNTAHIPCFQAGDHRNNEQLGLLSMHTVWMRQHNHVATQLYRINPHWDSDTLFQETRKVLGAQIQHITVKHWLPKVLGPVGMEKLGDYKGYNPGVNPTIINAFSTAAFRFGHSLINPIMFRLNASFLPIREGNIPLHRAFFAPFRIVEEGGIDPILRGLFGSPVKRHIPGQALNKELTEKLFKLAHTVALDLAALNIQRGRDHGLPDYNAYRKWCGFKDAKTFDDLSGEIKDEAIRQKLQRLYGHPGNIDLFVGGMSEETVEGARIGPTFMCIIVEQFRRLRDGDRFWYENPSVFSPGQLTQISQTTLSRIICDNSDGIDHIQLDAFSRAASLQDYLSCDNIPKVDLKEWTDCCNDCQQSGQFRSITASFQNRESPARYSFPAQRPPVSAVHNLPLADEAPTAALNSTRNEVDVIDARLEGMETVMQQLKHTVKFLHRKVKHLERRINGKDEKSCIDKNKKKRHNRQKWHEHDCKKCVCLNGQVECEIIRCPVLSCITPRKVSGQCCPVC